MSQMPADGHYEVLWPRAPRQVRQSALAPRLDTLAGKTVAQLWDFVFCGDQMFEAIAERIKAQFPDVRFVNWAEFGNIHGSDERSVVAALPRRLKELGVDAVITAVAA